jgi:LMBR1 domain-containing protein 1
MGSTGYNLFLIIVTIIAAVLIAAVTLYLLVAFSHPEDRNQAWWPKIVVCFSMFISISTVLLFPLDVANTRACDPQILYSDCEFTLPMRSIWFGIYIVNVVLVYLITPFTLFYYEADSDLCEPFLLCLRLLFHFTAP